MVSRATFDRIVSEAGDTVTRIELFGALLAKESRLGKNVAIVGGSAITIYTQGRYVSNDVDVTGRRERIIPVLERWGFAPETDTDQRVYWSRSDLGLYIDVIHRESGSGRSGTLRTFETLAGPIRVSAVEDLIVRRLMFWSRNGKSELMDQAVQLYVIAGDSIDAGYLESEVRYEQVSAAYDEMRRLSALVPSL